MKETNASSMNVIL